MTAEAMNRGIAESAGWHLDPRHAGLDLPLHLQCWIRGEEERFGNYLPNYAGDLNAMHGVEKTKIVAVTPGMGRRILLYDYWLAELTRSYVWHATAAQRAEALLRTIGEWED